MYIKMNESSLDLGIPWHARLKQMKQKFHIITAGWQANIGFTGSAVN